MNICFTGHRPQKLGGYDWNTTKNQTIINELRRVIIYIVGSLNEKEFTFICGGALGIDQMAFSILEEVKYATSKLNPIKINLVLAIPFEKQANAWIGKNDKIRYKEQKQIADEVVYVDTVEGYKNSMVPIGEYHIGKMQGRNQYMVDNSDLVIAVWDGSNGGTKNCIEYAREKSKRVLIINPNDINAGVSADGVEFAKF